MNPELLIEHACAFYVGDWQGNRDVKVECRSPRQLKDPTARVWAIKGDTGSVYSKEELWEYEPLPSSRDEEFFERCRYTLDEALKVVGLQS